MVPGNEGPGGREVLGFNPVFDTGGPDFFALPAEDVSVFTMVAEEVRVTPQEIRFTRN